MDEHQAWQEQYDALRARLTRIGETLGDRNAPAQEREETAAAFVSGWQDLGRHIKRRPNVTDALTVRS